VLLCTASRTFQYVFPLAVLYRSKFPARHLQSIFLSIVKAVKPHDCGSLSRLPLRLPPRSQEAMHRRRLFFIYREMVAVEDALIDRHVRKHQGPPRQHFPPVEAFSLAEAQQPRVRPFQVLHVPRRDCQPFSRFRRALILHELSQRPLHTGCHVEEPHREARRHALWGKHEVSAIGIRHFVCLARAGRLQSCRFGKVVAGDCREDQPKPSYPCTRFVSIAALPYVIAYSLEVLAQYVVRGKGERGTFGVQCVEVVKVAM